MPNSNINLNEFAEYKMNCPIPSKHSQYRVYYPKSIYHERLHDYSIDNPYIKLIREIARYFYGDDGVRAVELHLELDEIDHILGRLKQRIPAYLSRGLSGKTSDRETRKYIACSSFIRKYIFKKPQNILRSLKPSNLYRLKRNLARLLQMTVGEFLSEYGIKYEGYLKDKKILEVIREFRSYFGEFARLIKSLN